MNEQFNLGFIFSWGFLLEGLFESAAGINTGCGLKSNPNHALRGGFLRN
jgi:hypothetical protein